MFLRTGATATIARALCKVRLPTASFPSSSSCAAAGVGTRRGFSCFGRSLQSVKGERRRFFSSFRELPNQSAERFFVYSLIAVNTAVFLIWKVAGDTSLTINYGSRLFNKWLGRFMNSNFLISSNGVLVDYKFHTLLTSFFSHDSAGHFAMNMLTLFFFGMSAVSYLGVARFATLYFGGGLLSSAAFVAWPYIGKDFGNSYYNSRNTRDVQGLGASGAISAVIGWSVLTNPSALIYLWAVVPVPAALFGAYYIGSGLWNLYRYNDTAEVSHLGGASFGLLYFLKTRSGGGF